MSKCNHEQVCAQCVKAEIAKLESKIAELRKKLPEATTTFIGGTLQTQTYPMPMYPITPQFPNAGPGVWCGNTPPQAQCFNNLGGCETGRAVQVA